MEWADNLELTNLTWQTYFHLYLYEKENFFLSPAYLRKSHLYGV